MTYVNSQGTWMIDSAPPILLIFCTFHFLNIVCNGVHLACKRRRAETQVTSPGSGMGNEANLLQARCVRGELERGGARRPSRKRPGNEAKNIIMLGALFCKLCAEHSDWTRLTRA